MSNDKKDLLEPLDPNHTLSYDPFNLKIIKFWELLSKTDEAYNADENKQQIVDQDEFIVAPEGAENRFESIANCEKFVKSNPFDFWDLVNLIRFSNKSLASSEGLRRVILKLDKDPKQLALREIESEFHKVRGQFKRRGYTAQFVRDMTSKYPVIESQKTIERLVTRLKNETH